MNSININEKCQRFLIELYHQSQGDPSVQMSMYDIGANLGMDRDSTSRVAEELIGWELVEIKTLSGGIGISQDGIAQAQILNGNRSGSQKTGFKLGTAPVIDAAGRQALEEITVEIKYQAGKLGLSFDTLDEFVADLKTIDAQLCSPMPKTIILRECFRSLKQVAEKAGALDIAAKIKFLLEE
jgi:hypothetical protein